jgi:hypothetical protein
MSLELMLAQAIVMERRHEHEQAFRAAGYGAAGELLSEHRRPRVRGRRGSSLLRLRRGLSHPEPLVRSA